MHDVNDHPLQDSLNTAIAKVLSDSIKSLRLISKTFKVDEKQVVKQYLGSLKLFIRKRY